MSNEKYYVHMTFKNQDLAFSVQVFEQFKSKITSMVCIGKDYHSPFFI